MIPRLVFAAAATVLAVGALAGCAQQPQPDPTPTPAFTSEDEAFAAAEETYRAYVDALNEVDLSDPGTFEPVFAWTTGESNANERKSLSQMHADQWTVTGATVVDDFLTGADAEDAEVSAVVCSNVSGVDVVDSKGESMVSSERPDVYALAVTFAVSRSTPTLLAISSSTAVEDERCG